MAMRFPLGTGLYGMDQPDPNMLPLNMMGLFGQQPRQAQPAMQPMQLKKPKMPLGSGMYDPEPQGGKFALGSGLFGQEPFPVQTAPNQQQQPAQQPAPGGNGQTPTWDQKFGQVLSNPALQFGLSLLGSSNSSNPWGGALNNTLAAQMQAAQAKRLEAQAGYEKQRIGIDERGLDIQERKIQQDAENAAVGRALQERGLEYDAENNRLMREMQGRKIGLDEQQLAAQLPLYEAQAGLYGAQAGKAASDAAMEQQQLQMARQQMERQNKFFDQASGMLGGGLFNGEQPNTPAAAAPQGASGRYGTPQWILDGIMRTESGGNPTARGPVLPNGDRAMGAFQFIPSTVRMLEQKGLKFNPDDPAQARDAADFYLQDLLKQHGGDWNKALAAYGGHVKADPTPYINKVTRGQPLPGAQATQNPGPSRNQGLRVAQLGAMGAMAGVKGADNLVEVGKMMEPKSVQPDSYQQTPDGQLTYIPSPTKDREFGLQEQKMAIESKKSAGEAQAADAKRAEGQANALAEYRTITGNLDRMSQTVDELVKHPGLPANSGYTGVAKLYNLTPSGRDANSLLEELKSKVVVDTLGSLKASSANGSSGFGALSDSEGKLLQNYIGAFDRAHTFEQKVKALNKIKDFALNSKQNYTERFNSLYGNKDSPNVSQSLGATPQQAAPPQAAGKGGGIKFLGFE